MARNYPETVPAAYTRHDDLEDAYRRGWNHGHGIACHNVPSIGDDIRKCVDHMGIGDTVDAENIRDYHLHLCHAAADNGRDYSPFEFTAHEFNDYPSDCDEWEEGDDRPSREDMWQAFEEGTADAIAADLATYSLSDYGIEDEEPDQDEDWLDDEENAGTLTDWRYEVANGDTSRSYGDWLEVRREQNADRRAYLAKQDDAK
jgi:hypothetical protein